MYGKRDTSFSPTNVIGAVERTPSGNVAIRIGELQADGTWTQCGYVVVSADEARAFAADLIEGETTTRKPTTLGYDPEVIYDVTTVTGAKYRGTFLGR